MKKIKLTITGCMGRMGQQIIKSCNKDQKIKLYSLTESRIISKKINGIKPQINNLEAFKKLRRKISIPIYFKTRRQGFGFIC